MGTKETTRPRAKIVTPLPNYELFVVFGDGQKRIFDVKPYLGFPAFRGVDKVFDTVRIAGLSVEWATGADVCPDELYFNSRPASA